MVDELVIVGVLDESLTREVTERDKIGVPLLATKEGCGPQASQYRQSKARQS